MKQEDIHAYMLHLCRQHQIAIKPAQAELFRQFATDAARTEAYRQISSTQSQIVKDWKERSGIAGIIEKPVRIANARVGRPYSCAVDPAALGLDGIAYSELGNYEATGLEYDSEARMLSGIPATAGEFRLQLRFRHTLSSEDAPLSVKEIPLVINADPKSLWKDLPSDRDDPYWKSDADKLTMELAGRTLAVASKRGRSHAHEGKFRDDDFRAAQLPANWGLIAVADGAGSAKYARKGSAVACESLERYFRETLTPGQWAALDEAIAANDAGSSPETQKALSQLVLDVMAKAAMAAHNAIAQQATADGASLKDYSTTLIFALLRPIDSGWFVTSFWVGDGGIGIYSDDRSEVLVLGAPDGGEFAGQTRFVTMPDIFRSADLYKRCAIRMVPDFTALILMTDGITDPKFGTDANLGRAEKWRELWADLGGANEEGAKVNLTAGNESAGDELLAWLDFWSPGNHDDRTIAILF